MSWPGSPESYTQENLTREDNFQASFLVPADPVLDFALKNSRDNGLPDIAVSSLQGKFLGLIAKSIEAKRILEVGTLGGYSSIWLSRALPADGELVTLELEEKHARVARENLDKAGVGVSARVKIILGPAKESLESLKPDPHPFDLVFIDADKSEFVAYYLNAKRLVRSGGVIIIDNMILRTGISDLSNTTPWVLKIRELLQVIKDDKEVDATTIGTAGVKGYDGFCYIVCK